MELRCFFRVSRSAHPAHVKIAAHSFVSDLAIMNGTLVLIYAFFSEFLQMPEETWLKVAIFVMANAIFVLSDMLYKRLLRIYFFKYRDKISKFLK